MLNWIEKHFIDDEGTLNKKGMIVGGIIMFILLNIVGYLEGGGLFPWEM